MYLPLCSGYIQPARLISLVLIGVISLLAYHGIALRDHASNVFQHAADTLVMTTLNQQQGLVIETRQLFAVIS
jgi:hypothetical protein